MATLVSSAEEAIANIHRYNEGIASLRDRSLDALREHLPFNRAWYAVKTADGWIFGPSRFIGYVNMMPRDYLDSALISQRRNEDNPLDGRVTEVVLQDWSEPVEKGHPAYDVLRTALHEFCGRYGKKPNRLSRISIIKTEAEWAGTPGLTDDLVSLLAAVFRTLTPAQKTAFQKQIA